MVKYKIQFNPNKNDLYKLNKIIREQDEVNYRWVIYPKTNLLITLLNQENNNILGFMAGETTNQDFFIHLVWVNPKIRGTGCGKLLAQKTSDIIKDMANENSSIIIKATAVSKDGDKWLRQIESLLPVNIYCDFTDESKIIKQKF